MIQWTHTSFAIQYPCDTYSKERNISCQQLNLCFTPVLAYHLFNPGNTPHTEATQFIIWFCLLSGVFLEFISFVTFSKSWQYLRVIA